MSQPTAVLYGKEGVLAEEVLDELDRARAKFGPMASGHEAQSVIGEEFHEFTLAVWFGVDQKGRPADPRAEAVQIAAMALRYILDVADRAATAAPVERASEYGRLLAERDRLIGEGVDPDELDTPDAP